MHGIHWHKGKTDKNGGHQPKPGGPGNKSGGAGWHTHHWPPKGK